MTKKIVCPKRIFALFKIRDPEKLAEGKRLMIEWVEANIADLKLGDEILLPDPETGEPVLWVKTSEGGLTQ